MQFFVLRVASNKEDQVREKLARKVKIEALEEHVGRILVPTERVRSMKGGVRKESDRKLYPGYALGYQYQWWTFPGDDHAFTGQGVNGQFLYVNPAENLVIAVASAWPDFWVDESEMHTYALFDAVKKKLSE